MTPGSTFDGYANSGRFLDFLGKPPNEAILGLRDPQNRTREYDSVPKGPKISSYGPFSSYFVRISSQIEPNPTRPTWDPVQDKWNPVQDKWNPVQDKWNLGGTWVWILDFFSIEDP